MKLATQTFVLFIFLLSLSSAQASKDRGGGDLCEKRILEVADDISQWIKAGGSAGLNLPSNVTIDQYNSSMISAIESTKVRCVKPGDVGYPIRIDNTPKACRFDRTPTENFITCDYAVFMNKETTSENEQYVLVHHEYAGIAGIENPNDDVSTYTVSNQITHFLEFVTVQKLAIKPKPVVPTVSNSDAEADARILASCEAYKSKVMKSILTFISSNGGTVSQPLDIGTCTRHDFYANQPSISLTLPNTFEVVVMGDDGGQATLSFRALHDSAYPADKVTFYFWWFKKAVYDNLGKIDGYKYTFGYDDQSPNDDSYSLRTEYYYSVKNKETSQPIGAVRINY